MFFEPLKHITRNWRLYSKLDALLMRRLVAAGPSPSQSRLLMAFFDLEHRPENRDEPITHRLLANWTGIDGPQVSRTVKDLMAQGLVSAMPLARDIRQNQLRLTQQGQDGAERLIEQRKGAIKAIYQQMDPGDRSALAASSFEEGPPRNARDDEVALEALAPCDYGWMLSQAIAIGDGEISGSHEFKTADLANRMVRALSHHISTARWQPMAIVAKIWGDPVGAILVSHDKDGLNGELECLFVLPRYRRRGIGMRLLKEVLSHAQEMTMNTISAELPERLTPLDQVLRKTGFERSRTSTTDLFFGRNEKLRQYLFKFPLEDLPPEA